MPKYLIKVSYTAEGSFVGRLRFESGKLISTAVERWSVDCL